MKTSFFNRFSFEVSVKSIIFLLLSVILLFTSIFAVLKGVEGVSQMTKTIYVILDIIWVGGLIAVTVCCLFIKKRELTPLSEGIREPAHQEQEAEYTYIDLIFQ